MKGRSAADSFVPTELGWRESHTHESLESTPMRRGVILRVIPWGREDTSSLL